MDRTERERIDAIVAQQNQLVKDHHALWQDQSRAHDALLRARMMGVFGTPEMIADREEAANEATLLLRQWEEKHEWYGHTRETENAAELCSDLAARIASGR